MVEKFQRRKKEQLFGSELISFRHYLHDNKFFLNHLFVEALNLKKEVVVIYFVQEDDEDLYYE